jgi:hypothetical protein
MRPPLILKLHKINRTYSENRIEMEMEIAILSALGAAFRPPFEFVFGASDTLRA